MVNETLRRNGPHAADPDDPDSDPQPGTGNKTGRGAPPTPRKGE